MPIKLHLKYLVLDEKIDTQFCGHMDIQPESRRSCSDTPKNTQLENVAVVHQHADGLEYDYRKYLTYLANGKECIEGMILNVRAG